MLHFLWSIFFLVLIMLLTVAYIAVTLYCAIWIYAFWKRLRPDFPDMKDTRKEKWGRLLQPKVRKTFLLLILVFHLSIYVSQYTKWTGEDNAHWQAKQYWVAGQVLNGIRRAMTTFIHPDIPILYPADQLQQWIYAKGTQYLPADDGEIGVWMNNWFNYHYVSRGRWPLLTKSHRPSPKTVKLLDQWWFSLETMASKPFANRQMEVEHYYRDYPALAFHYHLTKGFYAGRILASAHRIAQMPEHVERSRSLVRWLSELKDKWRTSAKAETFVKSHPKVEALRQSALLFELQDLIQGEIYERKFACGNDSIRQYIATRQEFVNPGQGLPAYRRMKSPKQGRRLYNVAIEGGAARSTKYVIKRFCGVTVAGQEDNSSYERVSKYHHRTAEEQAEYVTEANFRDEINILETMMEGKDE